MIKDIKSKKCEASRDVTPKEYEVLLALRRVKNRTNGHIGYALVRIANGNMYVHGVNTGSERV